MVRVKWVQSLKLQHLAQSRGIVPGWNTASSMQGIMLIFGQAEHAKLRKELELRIEPRTHTKGMGTTKKKNHQKKKNQKRIFLATFPLVYK